MRDAQDLSGDNRIPLLFLFCWLDGSLVCSKVMEREMMMVIDVICTWF